MHSMGTVVCMPYAVVLYYALITTKETGLKTQGFGLAVVDRSYQDQAGGSVQGSVSGVKVYPYVVSGFKQPWLLVSAKPFSCVTEVKTEPSVTG